MMKKLLWSLTAAAALLQISAGEGPWLTDLAKAKAQAKTENKRLLLNFTGSDWCSFCKKLHKEVFQKPEFNEYASKNLVLVEVDFPSRKKQPADLQKANEALKNEFKIEGFPTLVLLDGDGKKLGESVGYDGSGPSGLIKKLDGFAKK